MIRHALLSTALAALALFAQRAVAENAPHAAANSGSAVSSGRAFLDPRVDGVFFASPSEGGEGPAALAPAPARDAKPPVTSGRAFLDPRVDGVFLADPGAAPGQQPAAVRATPTNAKDFWLAVTQSVRGRADYPEELKADPKKEAPSGRVMLSFAIDKDGRLLDEKISQSSGNATLDAAALDALRQATPFPPPPADVGTAKATLPIVFHAPPPEPKEPPKQQDSGKAR